MHHAAEVRIRPLTRSELDRLMAWAAAEGWNPGRNDGDLFWATDPEGFLAAEVDGGFAGGGAIVSYGGAYGFMGLFIVDPLLRGRGIGERLWHARRDRLRARLAPGAAIEMDGVFAMQAFYARGGFAFRHRELRFEWTAPRGVLGAAGTTAAGPAAIVPLADVPAAERHAFDRLHSPAERAAFMDRWITQPGCVSLGAVRQGRLVGMTVARPCMKGHKIGPLFAAAPAIAAQLLDAVAAAIPGEVLQLDVPECNPAAVALARERGMREVFGCARMTLGPAPAVAWPCVYGITTFELG